MSGETSVGRFGPRWARAAAAAVLVATLSACLNVERVSTTPTGGPANGSSTDPSLSADGRFVGFRSDASNLVADDTNGVADLFVRDNATRVVQRVSLAADGSELDEPVTAGSIGGDGRYAFFVTAAAATPDDADALADLFRRDLLTGATTLASVPPVGVADIDWPRAVGSPGGRYAAFADGAMAYRRDLDTGTTTPLVAGIPQLVVDSGRALVLVPAAGGFGPRLAFVDLDGSVELTAPLTVGPAWHVTTTYDLSPDGRFFASSINDAGLAVDTVVLDTETGEVRFVPALPTGFAEVSLEFRPSISADGRFVTYTRGVIDRLGGFVHDERVVADLDLGTVTVVEDDPGESPGWVLSDDGRWLARSATDDHPDQNGLPDVDIVFAHEARVVGVDPALVGPGSHTVRLAVEEAVGVPMVEVAGGGVSVVEVRPAGPGLVDVDLVVGAGAATGARDLVIRNRGDWPGRAMVGSRTTCAGCLEVTG
jgi:hypothetical protein